MSYRRLGAKRSGYRFAAPFYLGITFGLDVCAQSGVAYRRTGVVAGFATD